MRVWFAERVLFKYDFGCYIGRLVFENARNHGGLRKRLPSPIVHFQDHLHFPQLSSYKCIAGSGAIRRVRSLENRLQAVVGNQSPRFRERPLSSIGRASDS